MPGRATRTHSKPLTFDELCEEAFGVLNIHPWELWVYTYEDYCLKRKGFYNWDLSIRKGLHDDARMISYYAILADLKKSDQRKPIDKIVPSKFENQEPEKSSGEWLKDRKKVFEANRKMTANVKRDTKLKTKK